MCASVSILFLSLTLQAAASPDSIGHATAREVSSSPADPWGTTARVLAEKWGDSDGTVQVYSDLKTVLELHAMDNNMTDTIHAENDTYFAPIWDSCHLKSENCAEMAAAGNCDESEEKTKEFMTSRCAPACRRCHLLSFDTQCRYHKGATHLDALKQGDLNRLMENILMNTSFTKYAPITIYSMPGGSPVGGPGMGPICNGPWVLTLDNFLTDEECTKFIHWGETSGAGFRTSRIRHHETDTNANATDLRSSSTNWCNNDCMDDPVVQRVHRRLQELVGDRFPYENFEQFQILRYEEGQYYKHHLDDHPDRADVASGHRVLTVFLYLNTVESGGGTNFKDLGPKDGGGLTIMPKMGRALIWPSVLSGNPNVADWRTMHAGLPVERGVKYGANVWIRQRDYKTPKKICKM